MRRLNWSVGRMVALFVFCSAVPTAAHASVPSSITVQGKLTDAAGNPISGPQDFNFKIFDAVAGGALLWPGGAGEAQTLTTDTSGLWIGSVGAISPLTDSVFADTSRWLEITVAGTTLPRVRLLTGAFAFRTATVDGAKGGTVRAPLIIGHANSIGFGSLAVGSMNSAGDNSLVVGGSNSTTGSNCSIAGGLYNSAGDLASAIGGGQEDTASGQWCFIGGGRRNVVSGEASFIGGGFANRSTGPHNTIAGGYQNVAQTLADKSTIGGGGFNLILGSYATISGGLYDTATGTYSTVGGGNANHALGVGATVSGGTNNLAQGARSVVPGGDANRATGNYSFAAGHRARAMHHGTFVWADETDADFSSTAANQFLIRAAGGVGINTSSPNKALTVDGDMEIGVASGDYHHMRIGGGNSSGFLYGSWPRYGDGIHMGYNYYSNAAGNPVVVAAGGGTSRLSLGYGWLAGYVGGTGVEPTTRSFYVGPGGYFQVDVGLETMGYCDINYGANIWNGMTLQSGNFLLYGDIWKSGCYAVFTCPSDFRLKKNLRPLTEPLDEIKRLRGVRFDWRRDELPDRDFPEDDQIGLIAQEVLEVVPSAVTTHTDGYMSVDYAKLVPLLIEGMKEQQKQIEKLEATIRQMQP